MSTTRITGRVKWFNSKAGYGFITACEGELVEKDIFVHYSSIKSDAAHYKYLTQGEYVDFSLTKPANEKHEYHAVDVSGVKGGPILCETRRLSALASRATEGADPDVADAATPVASPAPATGASASDRKRKPRTTVVSVKVSSDSDGFTAVKKRAPRVKKPTV
uniref:CSD domain-containing protein n=1 Tax=viral metagenome TaxID=1070528 RepID=A0A6C0HIL1_9ZZZZ